METIGGSETGLVKKKGKQTSTPGIGASLTPDYRDKEDSNNMNNGWNSPRTIYKQSRCNKKGMM